MWTILALLAIDFAVGALAVACEGDAANQCTSNKCESVGNAQICTDCQAGNVPINGICTAKDSAANCKKAGGAELETTAQTCGQCTDTYFLYRGGCYLAGSGTGGKLCTSATDGVCKTPADGYFIPPGATKTDQSVISCSEGTEITANGKKYKGVANCKVCTPPELNTGSDAKPAVCTTCEEGYFGASCTACHDQANCATCSDGGEGKCTKCKTGKYLTTTGTCEATCTADTKFSVEDEQNGKRCFACGDTTNGVIGCEKCTAPGDGKAKPTCTKCIDGNYLKTVNDVTTCVTNCGDGYFQHTATSGDLKTCQLRATGTSNAPAVSGIQNCASCTYTSSTLKCTACGEGKKPNKEGTGCFDCGISGCAYCSGAGKCEECDGDKIVKTAAGATSCIEEADCTKAEGFFEKINGSTKTCEACGDDNCATCAATGMNQCSKCKTTGTKTYLKVESGDTGTCVEASGCGPTAFPKDDAETGNKCAACSTVADGGIENCAECSLLAPASRSSTILITCTKCENSKYLKEGTCVDKAECTGTTFPKEDTSNGNKCLPCNDSTNGGIADCQTCSKTDTTVTCSACTPDNAKKPNKAGTKCFNCQMAGCSHCSKDGVCEACSGDKKVSPGGSSCVTNCPGNSTASEGACICNSGFASSGDSCVASSRQPQHRYHSRISVAVIAACSVLLIICLPLHNEQCGQS